MLYLKACPRCKGDVEFTNDQFGHYMECLQCGFMIRPKGDKALARPRARSTTRAA